MNLEHSCKPVRHATRGILKNLLVIGLAFLGVFTAFQAISGLQSNVLSSGLGDYTMVSIYCSLLVSSILLPDLVIGKLGCKWTLVVCQIPYCVYIATMLNPSLYLCVPAAVLLGLAAAPLWTAKCEYLSHLSERYALVSKMSLDHVYSLFFGCYFMVFLSTGIWGNLIYYLVAGVNYEHDESTMCLTVRYAGLDGVRDPVRDEAEGGHYKHISNSNSYLLLSVYLSVAVLSVMVLAVYIDSISFKEEKSPWSRQLSHTLRHLFSQYRQWLIVPLTLWSGLEQGYFITLFTEAYVVCPLGVKGHAVAMMLFGLSGSLSAVIGGMLRRKVSLGGLFTLAALSNYTVLVLTMTVQLDSKSVIYTCVALWGVGEGVWQAQIGVLYAELFPSDKTAAFSNYRLWESLGFILIYLMNVWQVKGPVITYLLMACLSLGMVGYAMLSISMIPCSNSIFSKGSLEVNGAEDRAPSSNGASACTY